MSCPVTLLSSKHVVCHVAVHIYVPLCIRIVLCPDHEGRMNVLMKYYVLRLMFMNEYGLIKMIEICSTYYHILGIIHGRKVLRITFFARNLLFTRNLS